MVLWRASLAWGANAKAATAQDQRRKAKAVPALDFSKIPPQPDRPPSPGPARCSVQQAAQGRTAGAGVAAAFAAPAA